MTKEELKDFQELMDRYIPSRINFCGQRGCLKCKDCQDYDRLWELIDIVLEDN